LTPAFAQFDTAEVLGTIRDSSDAVLAKAAVVLTNQSTGAEAKTITDSNGNFIFTNVRIGAYTVSAEASGFSGAVAEDLTLDVTARERVDLVLQVGILADTVEVTDAAALLQTDSSERGQLLHGDQIVELPLNGRQYSDLAPNASGVLKA